MSRPESTGTIKDGEIVSFKMEGEIVTAVKKKCFARNIPMSMWLREAAREKLGRDKGGK